MLAVNLNQCFFSIQLLKFPYCKLHVLYAFQPKHAKEDDIISKEDVPKFIEKKIKSA